MKVFDPEKMRYQMAINGYNIRTLAQATGISENGIGRTVRGKSVPRSDTIGRLMKALNCDYNDFFTDKEDPNT